MFKLSPDTPSACGGEIHFDFRISDLTLSKVKYPLPGVTQSLSLLRVAGSKMGQDIYFIMVHDIFGLGLSSAGFFCFQPDSHPETRPRKKVTSKTMARDASVPQNKNRTSTTWAFWRIKTANKIAMIIREMRLGVIPSSFQPKVPVVPLRGDRSFSKHHRIPGYRSSIQLFLDFLRRYGS